MKTNNFLDISLASQIKWPEFFSSPTEYNEIRIQDDTVELLAENAKLRFKHAVPSSGCIQFQLYFTQIPACGAGTVFSNCTTTTVPEVGWGTFVLELRKSGNGGQLFLGIARQSKSKDKQIKTWEKLNSSKLLLPKLWYSVTVSWGDAVTFIVEGPQQDKTRTIIIDHRITPSSPFCSGLHYFGFGTVYNPFNLGQPVPHPPSLAQAKIRLPGVTMPQIKSRNGK